MTKDTTSNSIIRKLAKKKTRKKMAINILRNGKGFCARKTFSFSNPWKEGFNIRFPLSIKTRKGIKAKCKDNIPTTEWEREREGEGGCLKVVFKLSHHLPLSIDCFPFKTKFSTIFYKHLSELEIKRILILNQIFVRLMWFYP